MVDLPIHWEVFGAGVFLGVKFAPEGRRSFPPMATGKSEELTGHKVAGMRGYDIEKASFGFAVPQLAGLRGVTV